MADGEFNPRKEMEWELLSSDGGEFKEGSRMLLTMLLFPSCFLVIHMMLKSAVATTDCLLCISSNKASELEMDEAHQIVSFP